jgi:hypothetical protein
VTIKCHFMLTTGSTISTPNSKLSRHPFAREYSGGRVLPYYSFSPMILVRTLSGSIFVVCVVYIAMTKRPLQSSRGCSKLRRPPRPRPRPPHPLHTARVLCCWNRVEYCGLHLSNEGPVSCHFCSDCNDKRPNDLFQQVLGIVLFCV